MAWTFSHSAAALIEKFRFRWQLIVYYQKCPFGPEYQEAWNHRYELFSRFDAGIQTDAVGLYSVTPEKTAREIANGVKGKTIVDAFCGIGGNAIAFAAVCPRVFAIDIDARRMAMAQHNADIYRRDNIEFITGDFSQLAGSLPADAVFLDPPWGGPDYVEKVEFGLGDFLLDVAADGLLLTAFEHYPSVILRVPHNFRLAELRKFDREFQVQDNILHGRIISKTIFFS